MKKFSSLLLIPLIIAAVMLAGCRGNPKTEDEAGEKAMETPSMAADWVEVVLEVDGMTCEGCENAIKAGVQNLEGIRTVESSHQEGWTRVEYDQNLTSLEEIEAKITETGYQVKGLKEES